MDFFVLQGSSAHVAHGFLGRKNVWFCAIQAHTVGAFEFDAGIFHNIAHVARQSEGIHLDGMLDISVFHYLGARHIGKIDDRREESVNNAD